MAVVGEHHPAFEEYCECIFELAEDDVDVIQARIAERLNVSRPAVSEMMRRLEAEGLDPRRTTASTSPTTASCWPTKVVRRHRLAERFLTDILQLSWAEAHHEAGKWEHVMSEAVESAMDRLLGNPTTCPHGNPIPGSAYIEPTSRPLAAVDVGDDVHGPPDHRGAGVHARPARVPRGQRACSRATPARSPRRRPTARSRSRSTAATSGVGAFASARILVTRVTLRAWRPVLRLAGGLRVGRFAAVVRRDDDRSCGDDRWAGRRSADHGVRPDRDDRGAARRSSPPRQPP